MSIRPLALGLLGLLLIGGPAAADDRDADALAARVDKLLAARRGKVKAAPLVEDAVFLRRAYLDLCGRIPPVSEVRAFLADTRPDKRRRLTERLLHSPLHANHFANVLRAAWLPAGNNPFLRAGFEAWLRERLARNTPYDALVREILTGRPPPPAMRGGISRLGISGGGSGPTAFYQANEGKPEKLASSTARLFLGVNLECAQCHDHPRASWTREQFWQYAAFFTSGARPTIRIPQTPKTVAARFPDGTEPRVKAGATPQATLADWMMAPGNKFFARNAVNRLWDHFFGYGLNEPVDDLSPETRDELIDALAEAFVRHKYDLRFLSRALVRTDAYQRASAGAGGDARRLFTHMAVKALSPEQTIDSLFEATGVSPDTPTSQALRTEFLSRLIDRNEKRPEAHTPVLQALALMNGPFVADATSLDRSATLAAVADAPFLDTAGRVEALFLAVLSRPPRPRERAKLVPYVDGGGATRDSRRALADVYWALLNSSEFIFNH